MKYLPRDTDQSSYWDVTTGAPVTINERLKRCPHTVTTSYSALDRRDAGMQVWVGECCVRCGFLLTRAKRD